MYTRSQMCSVNRSCYPIMSEMVEVSDTFLWFLSNLKQLSFSLESAMQSLTKY